MGSAGKMYPLRRRKPIVLRIRLMCTSCENNRLPPPMSVRLKVVCPSAFGGIVRQGHAAVAIHHAPSSQA
ncbi:TTF-type domain-containing protein [Aphis craccivora]|uniref:TTF-type domain-containing protein n=1 Tax=Aphis craccivora TaxID=307492 RepID=A0A6G0ZA35_APHCR|nr:TTF-type domain-containing protein [Aphis craccivora]